MVYDGIVIGLIVGLLRGGWTRGFKAISELHIRAGWIFPVLLLVQLVIYYLQGRYEIIAQYSGYTFMAVYVVGIIFLWINRKESGFPLILLGVLMNFLAMALNGGRMPVSPEAVAAINPDLVNTLQEGVAATKHVMLMETTRLPFLGDIVPLKTPYPISQVISIGDIVMNVGIFVFLQSLFVGKASTVDSTTISAHKGL